jgi:hypothetical protein
VLQLHSLLLLLLKALLQLILHCCCQKVDEIVTGCCCCWAAAGSSSDITLTLCQHTHEPLLLLLLGVLLVRIVQLRQLAG